MASISETPNALKILVVEDHEGIRRTLSLLLKFRNYEVHEAHDKAGALALALTMKFDVLICDIGLPDGDGYEVLAEISALQPVKAIALTASGESDASERSRQAGFLVHLTKPIDIRDMEEALASVE